MKRITRLLSACALPVFSFVLILSANAQTVDRTVNLKDQIFETPLARARRCGCICMMAISGSWETIRMCSRCGRRVRISIRRER